MIVPMKRLTLIAPRDDEDSIMRALQDIGAVQIIATTEKRMGESALKDAGELRKRLGDAYDILKPYGKKKGMLTPTMFATLGEVNEALSESAPIVEEADAYKAELTSVQNSMDKLIAKKNALLPWAGLTTPVEELGSTKNVRILFGFIKPDRLSKLEMPNEAVLSVVSTGTLNAVMLAVHNTLFDELYAQLRELDFTDYSFPPIKGTVQDELSRIAVELESLARESEKTRLKLVELAEARTKLGLAIDAASIDVTREEELLKTQSLETVFVLEGWYRESDEELVTSTCKSASSVCYIETRDPNEDEEPPVAVKNPPTVAPFETITNLYSAPAYNGIDAAPLVMPFYLLFFGMMLADTGYGLILLIGGFLYSKLLKPRGEMGKLAKVLTFCGASTVICGMLTGSFFGMEWPEFLGESSPFPLIMNPMDNVMGMMIICCGLGLLHMMFGIGVKMYMCFKAGDWKEAIFNNFSWILLVLGLVAVLANMFVSVSWLSTVGIIMAGIGAFMMLFFYNRKTKNPLKRVVSGLSQLYNVTSYIGDTLSYVRILALGLAGGAMGMVFNLMGSMVFNAFSGLGAVGVIIGIVIAAPLLVALHAFSLFINALGAYVHTARLQFVEYFGKFYEGNGKPFKPLSYNTKYISIKR